MAKRYAKKQDRQGNGSVKQRRRTIAVRIAVILIILAMLVPFLSYLVKADSGAAAECGIIAYCKEDRDGN